ncbi:UDP binding domain-containing protein, partial [Rhizorhabdus dicambivorans]
VLQDNGARISAFDPEGRRQAEALLDNVDFAEDAYAAMDGADALVLVTEWNEFRALDLDRVRRLLKSPTIVDLRNIYRPEQMRAAGFEYMSVGRP